MKKLIFLLLVMFAFLVNAQDFTVYKLEAPIRIVTNDTIGNSGADTVDILFKLQGDWVWNYSVQFIVATISGTISITPSYYESLDGTNFELIATDTELTSGNLVEFFTDENGFYSRYLRIIYVGGGTQSTKVNAYLYAIPYKNY